MHTVFVIMIHTSLPLQLTFLLQKQAILLQSGNMKTRVLIVGINLYTALIISSHAQSLCDHDTHQSATSAHSSACLMAENHASCHGVTDL